MSIIQLKGGSLYQWDTDRQVVVHPWQNYIVDEVHFMNPNDANAFVVDPITEDEAMVANIPNILLQNTVNIRVFAVMHTDDGERTIAECTFGITERQKPSDYVYTETEVRTYEALDDRIKVMESKTEEIKDDILYTSRIPTFEEIDNTPFKDMIKACANNWFNAAANSGVVYESLSTDDVDNMAISVNPMIYATRNNNKEFTETYRDIWGEVKEGGTKAINCITLANMIIMGVSFECSRFNNDKNIIGSMGYGFDVCKYIDSTKDGNDIFYNPNKKLDITTFERILTQASFTETYRALGLVKTVKTSPSSSDGDIWYDEIKPGDVLFNSSHTMFCIDVKTTDGTTTVEYIDAGHNNNPSVNYHSFTFTSSSTSKTLVRVIRPYYGFYSPQLANTLNYGRNQFKGLDGPYPGIGKNENLNAYLTVGEYRCASDNNAKSLINKPASLDKAFKLVVENLLDDSTASTNIKYRYLKQTLTTVYGTVYYRVIKCDQSYSEILLAGDWYKTTATIDV